MRFFGLELHRTPAAGGEHRRLLGTLRPDLVVDVGANEGQFIRFIRDAGYAGPIVAVEPIPHLSAAVGALDGVETHNVAAGSEIGTAQLHVLADSSLSSLHRTSDLGRELWCDGSPVEVRDQIAVEVQRLEDLVGQRGERIFLKLDTQGHDLAAIRGTGDVLDRVVILQIEMPFQTLYEGVPDAVEILDTVTKLGFGLAFLDPVTRTSDGALVEADGLFVRRSN